MIRAVHMDFARKLNGNRFFLLTWVNAQKYALNEVGSMDFGLNRERNSAIPKRKFLLRY